MPVRVFDMNKAGALTNIMVGESEGTLIQPNALEKPE
jgi:uridylate kinase